MAQTFSYTLDTDSVVPLGDGGSLAVLNLTGPATSVGAGMTIASLSTDFTTIQWGVPMGAAVHNWGIQFIPGTSDAVASAKIHISVFSTGAQLADAVDLHTTTFQLLVKGRGPLGSTL